MLKQARCRLERQTDGYTLEIALPWTELGIGVPAKHTSLRGDVGVLLSDGSGTRTTGRRYLFNAETTIINDIPSEVRVMSANWGTLSFE